MNDGVSFRKKIMKTSKNQIILEDCASYSPTLEGVGYTDITGTRVFIPIKLLIRLSDGTREYLERRGTDWETFCENLFENEKNWSLKNENTTTTIQL